MNYQKILTVILMLILSYQSRSQDSQCFGSSSNGYLVAGIQLPLKGENYISYNLLGVLLGRTYLHSEVAEIIINAYNKLAQSNPSYIYKYAETGFANGGKFKPHRTHQNGLSVDFMVPVKDKNGKSVHFPSTIFNKFGYNVEFNLEGQFESYFIDFDAMATHIKTLHESAKEKGYDITRVIFDPALQSRLMEAKDGGYLFKNIIFLKKPSWVRHDEHYHIDFMIPCANT